MFCFLDVPGVSNIYLMQDSKKKEKELASWEADLKKREKVNFTFLLSIFSL